MVHLSQRWLTLFSFTELVLKRMLLQKTLTQLYRYFSNCLRCQNLFATILSTMYHCLPFLTRELNKGRNKFKATLGIVRRDMQMYTYYKVLSLYFLRIFKANMIYD